MSEKKLKINGIPTHGFPIQKEKGEDGINKFFADSIILSEELNDESEYENLLQSLNGRFYLLVKNDQKNSMSKNDEIFVPGLNGVCVFKITTNDKNEIRVSDIPYRTIKNTFVPEITFSFDNYINDGHSEQKLIFSYFNISHNSLPYIQIYEDGTNKYIGGGGIVKLNEDDQTTTVELGVKNDSDIKKDTTIHIYGLYKIGEDTFQRIYLGQEKIYPLPLPDK